jgi:hypothetical protein
MDHSPERRMAKNIFLTRPYSYNLRLNLISAQAHNNTTCRSKEKTKRGRPATLTDSARKRNRKEVIGRYAKFKINIGKEHARWMSLNDSVQMK